MFSLWVGSKLVKVSKNNGKLQSGFFLWSCSCKRSFLERSTEFRVEGRLRTASRLVFRGVLGAAA